MQPLHAEGLSAEVGGKPIVSYPESQVKKYTNE